MGENSVSILDLISAHFALRSSAWQLFGNKEMFSCLSTTQIENYSNDGPIDGICLAYCKIAFYVRFIL